MQIDSLLNTVNKEIKSDTSHLEDSGVEYITTERLNIDVNPKVEYTSKNLTYDIDERFKSIPSRLVMNVVDSESKELLKQYPTEEMRNVKFRLQQMLPTGAFFDVSA